jgi:hypothetical protein
MVLSEVLNTDKLAESGPGMFGRVRARESECDSRRENESQGE